MPASFPPIAGIIDLSVGADSVLNNPKHDLLHDLDRLGHHHRMPAWTSSLATGEPETLQRLGATLHGYISVHLAP